MNQASLEASTSSAKFSSVITITSSSPVSGSSSFLGSSFLGFSLFLFPILVLAISFNFLAAKLMIPVEVLPPSKSTGEVLSSPKNLIVGYPYTS